MDATRRGPIRPVLINYYFGGKEKVYLAVWAPWRDPAAEDRLDLTISPVDAIRRIVEFPTALPEPEAGMRLVVAEKPPEEIRAMRSLNRSIIDTLRRVLERGQRNGLSADIDGRDPQGDRGARHVQRDQSHTFSSTSGHGHEGDVAGRRDGDQHDSSVRRQPELTSRRRPVTQATSWAQYHRRSRTPYR